MTKILAIDIGGTFIKSTVIDVSQGLPSALKDVQRTVTPVGETDGALLIEALLTIARDAMKSFTIEAIGVVTPGLLDEVAGVISYATNLNVRNLTLVEQLESQLGVPVAFGHDGRASALAELHVGAGVGLSNFALMPIGTGISVGLVIDGEVPNSNGFIGEIGHANTGHDLPCGCGLTGCLEVVASTSGIAQRYEYETGVSKDSKEIFEAAHSGDEVALKIRDDAFDAIAYACDWLMNTLSPQAVIFAGGLSGAGDLLLREVDQRLSQRVSFQRKPELRIATLGDDAGCLGAGLLAMKRVTA